MPIEEYGISPVKVASMALCPVLFFLKSLPMTKALFFGVFYWGLCYFLSLLKGEVRFSTLGFLGLYLCMYITFYALVQKGAFTFIVFKKLLRGLILAYGITIVLQQLCVLAGVRYFPLINLVGFYVAIDKLPVLTMEPSHSARILCVLALAYWRCQELTIGRKLTVTEIFHPEHRWVTVAFLWTMMMMGSGTAFVGLGILCLYFITRQTVFYVIPLLFALFTIGNAMELKQMQRAMVVAEATTTGDINAVNQADGSAAVRVIPLINSFVKVDLTKEETWIGRKSMAVRHVNNKTTLYEQYGLIVFIIGLFFAYSCMIYRFFSIETLLYCFLFGFTFGNIYYTWGALLVMTGVTYFQRQKASGQLVIDDNEDDLNE
jgi:hypothetical protein